MNVHIVEPKRTTRSINENHVESIIQLKSPSHSRFFFYSENGNEIFRQFLFTIERVFVVLCWARESFNGLELIMKLRWEFGLRGASMMLMNLSHNQERARDWNLNENIYFSRLNVVFCVDVEEFNLMEKNSDFSFM